MPGTGCATTTTSPPRSGSWSEHTGCSQGVVPEPVVPFRPGAHSRRKQTIRGEALHRSMRNDGARGCARRHKWGTAMTCMRVFWTCGAVALIALPRLAGAELMIVGNDQKVSWDDAGKQVFVGAGRGFDLDRRHRHRSGKPEGHRESGADELDFRSADQSRHHAGREARARDQRDELGAGRRRLEARARQQGAT